MSFVDLGEEGYGAGCGDGDGDSYGDGSGYGYGYGYGYGSSIGDGYGYGYGNSEGYGEIIGSIRLFDVSVPFPGYVKVGCQVHSLEHWRANWRAIADKHEIEVYESDVLELLEGL